MMIKHDLLGAVPRTALAALTVLVIGSLLSACSGSSGTDVTPAAADPGTAAPSASEPAVATTTTTTGSAPAEPAPATPAAAAATAPAAPTATAATPSAPTTVPSTAPVAAPAAATTAPTTPAAPAATPAAAATTAAAANVTGTLIPLYTTPSDPSWAAVAAAKTAHPGVPVLAVVNPSNGPGDVADPGYTRGIANLAAAGVKVIGYVHTSWGGRPAAQLEADMDRWHRFYPAVTGVFFDEQATAAGGDGYYRSLTAYAKAHGFDFTVGNPGSDSAAAYVGSVDLLLIYENKGLPSLQALGGWHASYARSNFGVIPYGCPTLDPAFVQAARTHVAYVYVQSDVLPNPWDSVPAYLDALVGALE
jgi:Spherulation-specific family 4